MIILGSGARAFLEVISVRAINPYILVDQKHISFNKCGIAMASTGIQLIIDVIDYKLLERKYLVGMLSAHPMRLHN